VNVRRQQFLAGSRFADQQHAGIRPRRHGGLLHGARPGGRGADHLRRAAHQFAQTLVLLPQVGLLDGVLHGQQDAVAAQRLLQKIEGAGARGLHRVGDGSVSRNHDGRPRGAVLAHGLQQVDAVAVRQFHVEQVGVGAAGIGMLAEIRHRLHTFTA
jgi:hypothetical protein